MNLKFNSLMAVSLASTMSMASAVLGCDEKKGCCDDSASASFSTPGGLTLVGSLGSLDDATSIEIRIENGKTTARVNGEDIPADRIKTEDGKITILDDQGNSIREVPLSIGGGADDMFLWLGDKPFDAFGGMDFDVDLNGMDMDQLMGMAGNQAPMIRQYIQALPRNGGLGFNAGPDTMAEPPKVMVGISMANPDEALAKHLKLDAKAVTLVAQVQDGLPAAEAGLEQFDIITAVDGGVPAGPSEIREVLRDKNPGDTVKFTVLRAGEKKDVEVKVEAFDSKKLSAMTIEIAPSDDPTHFWAPQVQPLKPRTQTGPAPSSPGGMMFRVGPNSTQRRTNPDAGPNVEELQARIHEMNARMEEMSKRMNDLMEKLESQNH